MEFARGQDLIHLLYEVKGADEHGEPHYINKKSLSPFVTLQCVYKLLEQVSDLHQTKFTNQDFFAKNDEFEGLLHRDIKSANVLIDINGDDVNLNLIDFADIIPNRKDGHNSNTCCGSNGYTPPELIGDLTTRKSYSKHSDFFQTGITIAEIISSANYQSGIQHHLREYGGILFNDTWKVENTQGLMQDVFIKHYVLKHKPSLHTIEQNIKEIIYKNLIFPVLCELVMSMTNLDPALRLKNKTLETEIHTLKTLESICLRLLKNCHDQVKISLNTNQLNKELSKYVQLDLSDMFTSFIFIPNHDMKSDINELMKSLTSFYEPPMESNMSPSFS
jgi:serine/threonine protein kinase